MAAGCGAGAAEADARAPPTPSSPRPTRDPASACERLAPETRRDPRGGHRLRLRGRPAAGGPAVPGAAESVDVAGHGAQVRYDGDTVFLALFDDGWRVTAAGCRADLGRPPSRTTAMSREGDGMRVMFTVVCRVHRGRPGVLHRAGGGRPMTARLATRSFWRDNSLSLVFGGLLLLTLAGAGRGGASPSTTRRRGPQGCRRSRCGAT